MGMVVDKSGFEGILHQIISNLGAFLQSARVALKREFSCCKNPTNSIYASSYYLMFTVLP